MNKQERIRYSIYSAWGHVAGGAGLIGAIASGEQGKYGTSVFLIAFAFVGIFVGYRNMTKLWYND